MQQFTQSLKAQWLTANKLRIMPKQVMYVLYGSQNKERLIDWF